MGRTTMSTILFMTRSIGDTDGDMDGRGGLGIHGTVQYGDGHPRIIGTIGDAVRYGEADSTVTIISHRTSITSAEHSLTDTVLEREYVLV